MDDRNVMMPNHFSGVCLMNVSIIKDQRVTHNKGGNLSHVDGVAEINGLQDFAELCLEWHIAPGTFREMRKRQDHLESIQFLCFDFDQQRQSSKQVHDQLKYRQQVNHVI